MAEEQFGQIVLQTDMNEVYTLDLYEADGITCRGFYLPPPPEAPLPAEMPAEVRFAAPADVWSLLQEALDEYRSDADEVRHYDLSDPSVSNYRFYIDMARAPHPVRPEVEVWTGRLQGYGGAFTFILERSGSPEIVGIAALLIVIALLLFLEHRASERLAECFYQAVEACGERGVKRYSASGAVVTLRELRFNYNCEWECK
jgi:hypothetical protein